MERYSFQCISSYIMMADYDSVVLQWDVEVFSDSFVIDKWQFKIQLVVTVSNGNLHGCLLQR